MTRILFAPFSDCRRGVIKALLVEHGLLAVTAFLSRKTVLWNRLKAVKNGMHCPTYKPRYRP